MAAVDGPDGRDADLTALPGNHSEGFGDGVKERVRVETSRLVAAIDRLSRFISPALADLIIRDDQEALVSQRRDVSVVFLDLRRFTRFAESQTPDDVMYVLKEFHQVVGELVARHRGMVERFTGDGMMVYFNGPIQVRNPELRAVSLAMAAHERMGALTRGWRSRGAALGLGIGISHGVATVGRIGFEGRYDYAAIGAVTNLAARLCGRARAGETLVCHRIMNAVQGLVAAEEIGDVHLRGFRQPHTIFSVKGFTAGGTERPRPSWAGDEGRNTRKEARNQEPLRVTAAVVRSTRCA